MTDADSTSGSLPPRPDYVEVTVNLRRATAIFLDRLGQEMEVDRSEVCRQIIDLVIQQVDLPEQSEAAAAAAMTTLRDQLLAQERDDTRSAKAPRKSKRSWTKWDVLLERRQFRLLKKLAKTEGQSVSRTLRQLIVAFIDASDGREATPGEDSLPPTPLPPQYRRKKSRRKESLPLHLPATAVPGTSKSETYGKLMFVFVLAVCAVTVFFLLSEDAPSGGGPRIVAAAPWVERPVDVIFDHHSHTIYSDGELTVDELADLARDGGCDALAITDQSNGVGAVSSLELEDFRRVRQQRPTLLLFGGVEINMPSYGGREHANVIVDPAIEAETLPMLRAVAEASLAEASAVEADPGEARAASDDALLALAEAYLARGDNLLMIYNHPSREDRDRRENAADILRWNAEAPIFIGFAGAPGLQNAAKPGGYRKPFFTIDHWDPVVAEVGGTWDDLLSEGRQLWGALAGSDYSNDKLDKAPCSFARTHVASRDYSYAAVLDALRAGTFWADHGRILSQLSFTAEVIGLEAPVHPGSVVNLGGESGSIVVRMDLTRGPGSDGAPLQVEFISNCRTGEAEVLATEAVAPDDSDAETRILPASAGADRRSCFLRARVRLDRENAPDLMAYTNPIRFILL